MASTFVTDLNMPTAITTPGTYLYVADFSGIKKITIATAAVSVLTASTGQDLTTDGTSLYLLNGNAVEKVDMVTGAITLFAGSVANSGQADGVSGAATFTLPYAITSDGTSLYVSQNVSTSSLPLRKIDIASATVSTLTSATAGLGVTTDGAKLYYVTGTMLNKLL